MPLAIFILVIVPGLTERDDGVETFFANPFNQLLAAQFACTECQDSDLPEFFLLKDLHRFLDKRQAQIQCRRSFAMVNVRPLMDGVSDMTAPEKRMAAWTVQTLKVQNPIQQRLQLVKRLTKLPNPQFKSLVFALGIPLGNLEGDAAPQADQVASLLEWVNSELGCGLETLTHTLEELLEN